MEKSFHNFRPSVFPYANAMIVPIYIIFIPLWIIGLVLIDVESSPELSFFVLLFLLGCVAVAHATSAFSSLCKVKVSQDGISGFNFWGGITRRASVKWGEIEEVKPIRFFGLKYLRLQMLNLSEFFISKGADLNALDKWGRTCIHQTVFWNSPELVRFLLKHSADVNVQAGSKLKNLTPLAYARSLKKKYPRTDRREVIQLLIQNGAVE